MAVQIASGHVVQVRSETPERWAKALGRALGLGLEVFVVADTGERMVTSASQLDTLHRSDGDHCSCRAGLAGDPVCCHRAAVRFVQGRLAAESGVAPQPAACVRCNGGGVVPNDHRMRYDTCPSCGGTGIRPDHRPHGEPAVEIAA
jgi:hypothetical protein